MQQVSQARIQERAYQIWIREGCPHGRHAEHWRQAEFEIAAEIRSQAQTESAHSVDAEPALKKRASRSRPQPDTNAATGGRGSKKQAGERAIVQPPRK